MASIMSYFKKKAPEGTTSAGGAAGAEGQRGRFRWTAQADWGKYREKAEAVLVASIDCSAAFDTISHAILLRKLEQSCAMEGPALELVRSYLEGRRQRGRRRVFHLILVVVDHRCLSTATRQ